MTCQNLLRGATIQWDDTSGSALSKRNPWWRKNPRAGFWRVCLISRLVFFQGSVDNPDDDDDDDDGHNDCGVCAGPQDWFFQGPVEQILPSLPAISSQEQVIGSHTFQNHKYLNVGDKFLESWTFFILSGWQQHFLNLDTDELEDFIPKYPN